MLFQTDYSINLLSFLNDFELDDIWPNEKKTFSMQHIERESDKSQTIYWKIARKFIFLARNKHSHKHIRRRTPTHTHQHSSGKINIFLLFPLVDFFSFAFFRSTVLFARRFGRFRRYGLLNLVL